MNIKTIKIPSFFCIVAPVIFILYCLPGFSAEREYVVPMTNSKWSSSAKKNYECSLSQKIPYYGEAKFIHKSGNNVAFELTSNELMMSDVQVVIQSEPPAWRHDKVFEIGQFIFKYGPDPLHVKSPYASRMLQEIENGMSPLVVYRDLADGRDLISVLLSPINFRDSLNEYLECEKTLYDYDLDEIKNLKIYFATNKSTLSKRSKRDLKNIIRYLKLDPAILQIKVEAHADGRGRRRFNDRLSEARSAAVVKYLLSVGAKKEMIYAVNYGERASTHNNKSSIGRAKNRRADVQLLTTAPPSAEEQIAIEKARKAERRKKLFENSIFEGVPKKSLRKKHPKPVEKAETTTAPQPKEEPIDDEPPAPNFINLEHLVKPNK